MWIRPRTTTDVLPIDVQNDGTPVTSFEVAIVPFGDPAPTTGFVAAVADGDTWGATVTGRAAGLWSAYPRVGTKVLNPIVFRLTP